MNKMKVAFLSVFVLILLLPVFLFNIKSDTVSEIDNRKLTEFPFDEDTDDKTFQEKLDSLTDYTNDRIGLRDEMVLGYTVLNDKLFGEMIHPLYMYGKDGYVFFSKSRNITFDDYHQEFAYSIIRMRDYCASRNVPFIFVFDPEKASVLQDKLPDGMYYNDDWVDTFLDILEENGVDYVNNYDVLSEKSRNGENVFNVKYDAGHWNDLGSYYGTNNILAEMKNYFPEIRLNDLNDFNISSELNTSLPASLFPINEYSPLFTPKKYPVDITGSEKDEINRHYRYQYFYHSLNADADSPKTLIFQGSYMDGFGYKFMANALSDYTAVQAYQNIYDFDYYFNIFEPECVVFETAEYVFSDAYYDIELITRLDLAPAYESFKDYEEKAMGLRDDQLTVSRGKNLTTIDLTGMPDNSRYAYILIDGKWRDMSRDIADWSHFTLSLYNENYKNPDLTVVLIDDSGQPVKYIYK